jgi:hypothetical protein
MAARQLHLTSTLRLRRELLHRTWSQHLSIVTVGSSDSDFIQLHFPATRQRVFPALYANRLLLGSRAPKSFAGLVVQVKIIVHSGITGIPIAGKSCFPLAVRQRWSRRRPYCR